MAASPIRVLDRTSGIAGQYCTKLLADAGAEVVVTTPQQPGALGELFATSKRFTGDEGNLALGADLVVTNDPTTTATLREANPSLVVTTITPWGASGPWVGRPANEFTLQATCGSTGNRGLPDAPPIAAGGSIGEWITGAYAAAASLAAVREARRSGQGDHVDVSLLECMAVTMATYPSVFATFLGWPPMTGTGRSIEVPSVEPTTDGYVAFTTNSGQQFADFLVLIGHPELIGDPSLSIVQSRFKRRVEFLKMVHEYTTRRSTEEVLDEAAALRIPSGPVLNAKTVTELAHLVERKVFVPGYSGRFVQPRVPYRISGFEPREFTPPEVDVGPDWPARRPEQKEWQLPLAGLRVVDCTGWWAGPMAPHMLACFGADVIKVESTAHPDGMRLVSTRRPSDERWWEWGPMFHALNATKRGVTLDLGSPEGLAILDRLLGRADVFVENFTPRVIEQFGLDWETVHERYPSLVMVRMPAFGLDGPWRDRTGFAQTMECISGMAWRTGWPDGPPMLARGPGDPIAGTIAVIGTLLALNQRDGDGQGRLVESVMVEAALNAAAEAVVEYGTTGRILSRQGNRSDTAAPQGVYACAGDDTWVAISVTTDAQWAALRAITQIPIEDRYAEDAIDVALSQWCSSQTPDEVETALIAQGVPAAVVITARDILHNPHLQARGLFEPENHPVTGLVDLPAMPFRLSRVVRWNRSASPTLGQHNAEVLAELGLAADIADLQQRGIIGDRL